MVAVSPGFRVPGEPPETMVKPDPVMEVELTVTGDVPVEVRVIACLVGEFTVTLPKLRLAVLTESCGLRAAAPVPLRVTTAELAVEELLAMVICPLSGPVVDGLN